MSSWIILFLLFCNKGSNTCCLTNTNEHCGHTHGYNNRCCAETIEECGCNTNNSCIQPRAFVCNECERDNVRECNNDRNNDCDCDRRFDERDQVRERDLRFDRDWNRERNNGCDCDRNPCRN